MFSPPIFYFFLIYIFRWGAFHYWVALLSGKVEFNFQTSFPSWGNILNMSTCCCAIRLLFLPSLYCDSSVVTTLPLLLICKREVFSQSYVDFILIPFHLKKLWNLFKFYSLPFRMYRGYHSVY